ncbi:MAG: FHA domain-containing protein [Fimbriimonadaceae bacterium]|nr:FHA domain-containing protein [Fimbriimonadaceae bacterium]
MYRAMVLAIAGLAGGALAFFIREPFVPPSSDLINYRTWETFTGLALGALIGLCLGVVSGYFQGSTKHMTKGALLGGIIGAAAGAVGISFGNVLYGITGIRFLGWAIMGGVIGLAEGAVGMSWKRAYYGLIGGILGGALGGFLFDVVATVFGPTLVSMQRVEQAEVGTIPRAIGFSMTGLGIGLLIGVVEAIARKAWVRLVLGRNEGKDWPIDAAQTFLGRAEDAHVPLRGDMNVAPFHACIRKEGPSWMIYDMQTPIGIAVNGQPTRQATLNHGDTFQIGTHTLQFMLKGAPAPATPSYTPQHPATPSHAQPTQQFPATPSQTQQHPAIPQPNQATPSNPQLKAMNGPLAGQSFPIHGAIEVGRESGPIPLGFDAQVSRRHARIEATPQGIQVTDLGSTNGTQVNGVPIQSQTAKPGETITIGHTTFRVA